MYLKYLVSFLTALSFITFFGNNSVGTPYVNGQKQTQKCDAASQFVSTTRYSKLNQDSEIDFSKQLKITTSGSKITARFSSPSHIKQVATLDKLAKSLGYKTFDWVNYVVNDPHGIKDHQGQSLSTPYNDPPAGGYEYGAADKYPFYWDIETCENCLPRHSAKHPRNRQNSSLTFEDNPSDYRLQKGESVTFITHLVGRKVEKSSQGHHYKWDILSTFSWELTNTSTGVGKVALLSSSSQALTPSMLTQIRQDGGSFLPTTYANKNSHNLHSHRCR